MPKQSKQFGTWSSPVSVRNISSNLRLNDVAWDGDTLIWSENRGKQGVLVAQTGVDAPRDLTDSTLSVRGQVGYGGGEFTAAGGYAYFTSDRLYKVGLNGGKPKALTPAFGGFAAPAVSPDGKWVVYVFTYERRDGLAVVDTDGAMWPRKIASDTDFMMQPVWHPSGNLLAYIAWNHPNMPWDGTELRLATLKYDQMPYVESHEVIAGDTDTAIFQPEFSPDGRYLAFISDANGFGQLYLYDLEQKSTAVITEAESEHGIPAWVQGLRVYAWSQDSRSVYFIRNEKAIHSLWHYHLGRKEEQRLTALDDYTHFRQIAVTSDAIALIASSSRISPRVISYVPDTTVYPSTIWLGSAPSIGVITETGQQSGIRVHQRATMENIPAAQLAEAHPVEWSGHDGENVYGLYYSPTNDAFEGIGAPPLILIVHGGPTGQTAATYDADTQFFATRGFAVLQVNYRGSTGYGRDYMLKLRGSWGIYDVEDSITGAQYLASQGLADISKVVIMGGSAGGYTVLQSLVDKPGFYKAAICKYGVSNQFLLAQDTHKFEERYTDSLLGPLPQTADLYRARSPIFHADKIVDPIIIFQGADDPVVPQNQSDSVVAKLKARGIPHEYHVYEGEGHGFRKPETLEHYYKAAIDFLMQYVIYA